MIRLSLYIILFAMIFFGCDDDIDKSFISHPEKLVSPKGGFTLYRYHIENSMAFGSGFTVIKILNAENECDYTDRDFFRFDNDYPFWIKWKNEDTLTVKCLIDGGGLADQQPVKKEIMKWKDWTFEVEYYSLFSATAETKHFFDSYSIDTNSMKFKSTRDSCIFKMNEVQFSLDSNHIYATQFKIDTFESKLGISLSRYDISIKDNYKQKDFLDQQAFLKTKP